MTLYDIINWKTGNINAKCQFSATLCNAVEAAKAKDYESMIYHMSLFSAKRAMYNAMEIERSLSKENCMSYEEECKIDELIRKVYRRAKTAE